MTEDDTFRILTRCTWVEMRNIFRCWMDTIIYSETPAEQIEKCFKDNGWTQREFYSVKYKREQQRKK